VDEYQLYAAAKYLKNNPDIQSPPVLQHGFSLEVHIKRMRSGHDFESRT
jgi:hypothetical protein